MTDDAPAPSIFPLGLVVASATAGALLGIGHRLGSMGLPFAATAAALLRRTATSADGSLVTIGIGLHVVVMLAWTALFGWLVRSRGWNVGIAALTIVLLAHVANWLIAWQTGNGIASVLPLGDRIVFAMVFAAALTIGIRFAFSPKRRTVSFE